MYDMLKRKATTVGEEAIQFTSKFIQTPSVSLKESQAAALVEEKMNELEFDEVVRDEIGNVIGIMYGYGNGPVLLLNSHLDTVNPTDRDLWDADPWSGQIEEGRIFGVGASDCKGGLASQLYAASMLKQSLFPLKGTLIVAATVAEENGRSLGVQYLMEKTLPSLELKPDFCVLGEPTNLGLNYGHDGWIDFDIHIDGENEFCVEDAAQAIFQEFESVGNQTRNVEESFTVEPPYRNESADGRRASIRIHRRLQNNEAVEQTMATLKRRAELATPVNQVAVAVDIVEELQETATGKTLMVRNLTQAWETNPFHPMIERIRQGFNAAGIKADPGKWSLRRLGMGTAGSAFTHQYKLPVVGYGPGAEEQAHVENEYVEAESLIKAVFGNAVLIHTLIGIPVFGWTTDEI